MKRMLLISALVLVNELANAVIIDMGDYNRDTETGLDWLDLSKTMSLSAEEALSGNAGWSFATKDQFHEMYNQFDGSLTDGSLYGYGLEAGENYFVDETYGYEYVSGFLNELRTNGFTDRFGAGVRRYNNGSLLFGDTGIADEYRTSARGWYLFDDTGDHFAIGGFESTVYLGSQSWRPDSAKNTVDSNWFETDPVRNLNWGYFMVREYTVVPVPAAVWLFMSGMLVLASVARRRMIISGVR